MRNDTNFLMDDNGGKNSLPERIVVFELASKLLGQQFAAHAMSDLIHMGHSFEIRNGGKAIALPGSTIFDAINCIEATHKRLYPLLNGVVIGAYRYSWENRPSVPSHSKEV